MPTGKRQRTLRDIIFEKDFKEIAKRDGWKEEVIEMPPKAVGYCRVSTNMQVETGISLDTQKRDIENFANYKKLSLKIFSDDGISAAQYETRPGLIAALKELNAGDVFIVSSLSRMSRSVSDALQINDVINEKKASLYVLDINLDMSSPSGRMLFTVIMSINQMERENISQKVSQNMRNLSSQGKLKTKPPFGWKSPGKGLPFVKDEKEQLTIKAIRRFVNNDFYLTLAQLVEILNHSNYKPRNAKMWYHRVVKNILDQNNIVLGKLNNPLPENKAVEKINNYCLEDQYNHHPTIN